MNVTEWIAYAEDRGLTRRGLLEEALLFAYFERRAVAVSEWEAGEVYERHFGGSPLLLSRRIAVGIGREFAVAGASFDGGDPQEGGRGPM